MKKNDISTSNLLHLNYSDEDDDGWGGIVILIVDLLVLAGGEIYKALHKGEETVFVDYLMLSAMLLLVILGIVFCRKL